MERQPPLRLLFVCVENACRSQLAEALARLDGGDDVEAFSAGSKASGVVNPTAIRVLEEVGADTEGLRSKTPAEIPDVAYDAVVTMGCGDACPVVSGRLREDWVIADPKGGTAETFRATRDEIRERVRGLLAALGVMPRPRRGPRTKAFERSAEASLQPRAPTADYCRRARGKQQDSP